MRIHGGLPMLALAALTILPADAGAADADPGRGFGWFVSAGAEGVDSEPLNAALRSAGFPEPERTAFTLGGGGYVVLGRVLLGGEGYGSLRSAASAPGGRQVRATGGSGHFTVGVVFSERPGLRFYPYAGVGGRGLELRLDDPSGVGIGPDLNDPTFAQVLGDPGRRSDLTAAALALDLGFGVDLVSPGRVREGRTRVTTRGLLVGVRAGYQWVPARDDWRLYHARVIGGPDDLGAGWYVRLNVGGGGTVRRRAPEGS